MLTERQLQQLNAENELLILQLEDVNEVIRQREAELDQLRATAVHAKELQSRLDMNLVEFEQMQNNIGDKQQENEGASGRIESLEQELFDSIKMERSYLNILDEKTSLQANLLDTNYELDEAASLYKKLKQANSELGEVKSTLEICRVEMEYLKGALEEERELNKMLMKKK